ncbi:MAG: tetratricopeptide repeat protein [Bacteroidales bacterium]|nr:tetratricopeptide repeat protein [Bacteroidales bacterium]MCF8344098.1 tetratricopeptide repeat protein [Bacteroidales bacterium]MCF8375771.1 tetratricopeptide repeat protein [Bacteroidales bacterium]MCF8402237.1 tetratricopeptide repeat protein [Bacteroidales bacterium]
MNTFLKLFRIPAAVLLFTAMFATSAINAEEVDSLLLRIRQTQNDSLLINMLVDLALLDYDEQKKFQDNKHLEQAQEIASSNKLMSMLIYYLNDKGVEFRNSSVYPRAIALHRYALKLAVEHGDPELLSRTYNNIGVVYRRLDDYQNAVDYHLKALKISDEMNDKHGMAVALNSIGNIDFLLGNSEKALAQFTRALKIEEEEGKTLGIAINLNNIGNVYKSRGDYDKALDYYYRSLEINVRLHSDKGVAICNNDIGAVYLEMDNNIKALEFFLKALDLQKKTGDSRYVAQTYSNVGKAFAGLGEHDKALYYTRKGLDLAIEVDAKAMVRDAYLEISSVFRKQGDYKNALLNYEFAMKYRDSILNERNQRNIAQLQVLFEKERMEKEMQILRNESRIKDLEINRKNTFAQIAGLGLIVFLILFMVIFWAYTNKIKSNKLLEDKNQEINKARNELRKYADDMLSAKEKAIQASQTKSQFLANMSHEIRTPLNSIIGFTELMASNDQALAKKSYLESIKSSSESLLSLIEDILDLSKIESGKVEMEYEAVNLYELCEEIRAIFMLKIQEKGLDFHMEIDNIIPRSLLLSKTRLRQVLFNLVGNAIKFTEKGHVKIKIYMLQNEGGQKDLLIEVSDTGIGIHKEEQKKIFEAFQQSEYSRFELKGGTGLGLTISRRLVEMMGGEITLESRSGEGSRFLVRLKNVVATSQPYASRLVQHDNIKEINFKPARVMVVDDIKNNRDLIVEMLSPSALEVFGVESGSKAIELANSLKPDLIFLDIRMPKMNGFEVINQIKGNFQTAHIPVVALTAFAMLDEQEEFTRNRFDGYLKKPVQRRDLIRELKKHLKFETDKKIAGHQSAKEPDDWSGMQYLNKQEKKKLEALLPEYKRVIKNHFINEIIQFGKHISEAGRETGNAYLVSFGDDLLVDAETFDIENMDRRLREFQNVVKQL